MSQSCVTSEDQVAPQVAHRGGEHAAHHADHRAVLVQEAVGHVLVAEHDAGDEGGAGQQHCIVGGQGDQHGHGGQVHALASHGAHDGHQDADDYQVLGHVGENYTDDNNDQREDEYALALKHGGEHAGEGGHDAGVSTADGVAQGHEQGHHEHGAPLDVLGGGLLDVQ